MKLQVIQPKGILSNLSIQTPTAHIVLILTQNIKTATAPVGGFNIDFIRKMMNLSKIKTTLKLQMKGQIADTLVNDLSIDQLIMVLQSIGHPSQFEFDEASGNARAIVKIPLGLGASVKFNSQNFLYISVDNSQSQATIDLCAIDSANEASFINKLDRQLALQGRDTDFDNQNNDILSVVMEDLLSGTIHYVNGKIVDLTSLEFDILNGLNLTPQAIYNQTMINNVANVSIIPFSGVKKMTVIGDPSADKNIYLVRKINF